MASKTAKKKSQKGKKSHKNKKNKIPLFLILGFVILFLAVEVVSIVRRPAGPQPYLVQTMLSFSGDDQPSKGFQAWDLTATPWGFAVSDQLGQRVIYFDAHGKYVQQITVKEAGGPAFRELSGITSDPQGDVYVLDTWNGLIRGFDPKGKPMSRISLQNFYGPRGVAWDNGAFAVADTGTHRLVKVGLDGSNIAAWGQHGSGNVMFDNPMAVAVDGQGRFYVADQDNNRIECLDAQGKFVQSYDLGAKASYVTVDSKGQVYGATQDGVVKLFGMDGKYIGDLTDNNDRSHPLQGMKGLTITPNGDLAVVQQNQVLVLHLIGPIQKQS